MEKEVGMKLRSFKWVGRFSKANRNHFVEFYGWNGEIYVKDKGILTYKEYYKGLLKKGMCLHVDGMIIAKQGYSDHFNSLHKSYIGKLKQQKSIKQGSSYPVNNLSEKAVFESAVQLYKMKLLSVEQLEERIKRYIKPGHQQRVLVEIADNVSVA